MRDDVNKALYGFDTDVSKVFHSNEVELKWYDDSDESKTRLRKFVNKRIAWNFKRKGLKYNEDDPWETLFNDTEGCYGYNKKYKDYKSAFKYISDYTFLRPRDFILFLDNVGKKEYRYPIKGNDIGLLLQKYAKDNEKELRGELAIQNYSQEEIQNIFNALRSLLHYQYDSFNKQLVLDKLSEQGLDNEVFQTLCDYYLLIPFDPKTGNYYIGYRDAKPSDYGLDYNDLNYKLHKCIHALFVPQSTIPDGYRD